MKKLDVKFAFTLRDVQRKPAEIVMKAYKETRRVGFYIYNVDLVKQLWHYILFHN